MGTVQGVYLKYVAIGNFLSGSIRTRLSSLSRDVLPGGSNKTVMICL